MDKLAIFSSLALLLGASMAFADDADSCDGPNCRVPTRTTCFNVVCYYQSEMDNFKNCRASATFKKNVTKDGGEVADDSTFENNPRFEVQCDGKTIFNNSARRFTGMLGTRIQAEAGPLPAIFLPRGELHGDGYRGNAGDHVSMSYLELDTQNGPERLQGTCHIWTGAPFVGLE